MKLSTKGRYAVIALVDLVHNQKRGLVNLQQISDRQNISLTYLEQLFVKLRRARIVRSVRGPGGGYKLARLEESIRISEIFFAVDEKMNALDTGGGASETNVLSPEHLLTVRLWEQLSANVYVFLHHTRLSDILYEQLTPCPAVPNFIVMVDE